MEFHSTNGGDPRRPRLEEERFLHQGAIGALAIAAIAFAIFVVGIFNLPWWLDALALAIGILALLAAITLRRRITR
jgi:hypothetical protein